MWQNVMQRSVDSSPDPIDILVSYYNKPDRSFQEELEFARRYYDLESGSYDKKIEILKDATLCLMRDEPSRDSFEEVFERELNKFRCEPEITRYRISWRRESFCYKVLTRDYGIVILSPQGAAQFDSMPELFLY